MKHRSDELTEMAAKHLINEVARLQDEVEHLKNKIKTEKTLRWHMLGFIEGAGLGLQFRYRCKIFEINPPDSFMTGPEVQLYPNNAKELKN
jgi:hypothetical protein